MMFFKLLRDAESAIRRSGWKGGDDFRPSEARRIAERFEAGDFRKAKAVIKAHQRGALAPAPDLAGHTPLSATDVTGVQAPVAVSENRFGENLVWFLKEFAGADNDQLEFAELEIIGESESGVEGTCTVTVQEICEAAAAVLESRQHITERDARAIARSYSGGNDVVINDWWLEVGSHLIDKLNAKED